MADSTKDQKKQLKRKTKEMMAGNDSGQADSNSSEEPSFIGILWDAILEPLIFAVVMAMVMNYAYKDQHQSIVANNHYYTYSCQEMMDALDKNPINAKKRFVGKGIKIIGCKISSIGKDGNIHIVPIEGLMHFAKVNLRLRHSDRSFVEKISVGNRCTVWGTITGVTDGPFPNYVMDVANMTAR